MKTIVGIAITYLGFGSIIFAVRENPLVFIYFKWTTAGIIVIAGIVLVIIGTLYILVNAKWKNHPRK